MVSLALPPGVRHITLDQLPRQPWRNGGGLTRPVAEDEHGRWRVSCADITRDGPYSAFPGMQRLQVLIEGGRVELGAPGWQARLQRPLDDARFDGAWAVQARVPQGPARVWNLMLAQGEVEGEVHRLPPGSAPLRCAPKEHVRLLLVLGGRPQFGSTPLSAGSVLVCPAGTVLDAVLDVGPTDIVLLTRIAGTQT